VLRISDGRAARRRPARRSFDITVTRTVVTPPAGAAEPGAAEATAENVRWDLSDLYDGPADPADRPALSDAEARAEAFASRFKGRLAALELGARELAEALAEYEKLQEAVAKPGTFASLVFAADASEANGAFYQKVRERTTRATLPLIFFDLELMAAPAEKLAALRSAERDLTDSATTSTPLRAFAPFRLSEPEERVLEEQSNTARRAWTRLYEEITSNLRFTFGEGEAPLTLAEILDLQYDADRDVRRAAADALTEGLAPHARTIAFIFNTLLQDKATQDRLRGYAFPEQARHLGNELSPDVVETVVETAEAGFTLVAVITRLSAAFSACPNWRTTTGTRR
jgi:oligoendopeptidase F